LDGHGPASRRHLMIACAPWSFVHGAALRIGWKDARVSLPELIFQVVSAALGDSRRSIQEMDSVVLAAHDVVDGRSLSSMVTAPAAGAYLKEEIRLAEDGLAAVSLASAQIEAGEAEFSIVAAWGRASEGDYIHTSRSTLDPFMLQPFALDELSLSALRLSEWIGRHGERRDSRQRAAAARATRAQRNSRSIQAKVRPRVQFPLHASEAPLFADVAVAVILGRQESRVRIAGVGHSAESGALGSRKLSGMLALREAASRGLAASRTTIAQMHVLQLPGPTVPDEALALEALGLAAPGEAFEAYASLAYVNPSGGGESGWCFPTAGLVNFIECYLQLTGQAGDVQLGDRQRALAVGVSPAGAQVAHAVVLEAA
jgi:acetyl-CoA C-acetyltransferase